jgi:geranylgeranyl pyrophosphate synthase
VTVDRSEASSVSTQPSLGARVPDAWTARRTDEVLARAEAFAREAAPTPQLRALLDTALIGLRDQVRRFPYAFYVHLPLLVYGGLRGDDAPAVPLAAATSLFFLGLDICDDLADGDLPGHWAGYRPSEISLVSLTLLATLPQLAIAGLDAPSATREAMQVALARGLLQMIGGQQRDVRAAGTAELSAEEVEESVAAKSGEELAICTALAARLAGAPPEQVERYAALGRAMGTLAQLASDVRDVFHDPHGKDLAAGTRTLPIVLYLNRLQGRARADFLALLARARQEEAARDEARQQLNDPWVLRRCALTVEVYRQRAARLLDELSPQQPAYSHLRTMLDGGHLAPRMAPGRGRLPSPAQPVNPG